MIEGILQKQILGSEQNNGKNITRLTKMLETCLDHPKAQSYVFKHLDGLMTNVFETLRFDQEFLESCDFSDTISHP